MNKLVFIFGALLVTYHTTNFAEETLSEQCQRYATEDSVTMEQMDEYIMQCIADLQGVEMESQSQEESLQEPDPADSN